MKISDIEVVEFRTTTFSHPSKWGFGHWGQERDATQTITRITTDEGAEGYMLGGRKPEIEGILKPMLLGEDPFGRERLWSWMDQAAGFGHSLSESQVGIVDCALWDLFGRVVELPVSKILGGTRERVKAYASTGANLGGPEVYAEHALKCRKQGYKAYKIHAYICWDPIAWKPAPQLPGSPIQDVEVCKAVRDAVGEDMTLMHDAFGSYTLEESIWVGRELEKLGFYWFEHPMNESRTEAYRRLTRELEIPIVGPEQILGSSFSRAEWVLQEASDILRIDHTFGGISACFKLATVAQAFGIKCEMHGGGWANSQVLGAMSEATCEYYERGLLRPGHDSNTPPPYLKTICDPLDANGNVVLPCGPGLGMEFEWDYIHDNLVS